MFFTLFALLMTIVSIVSTLKPLSCIDAKVAYAIRNRDAKGRFIAGNKYRYQKGAK